MTLEQINEAIKQLPDNQKELVSDGYHTFKELYAHRVALFIALCNSLGNIDWKSKLHADGTMYDGWFIAGIGTKKGKTLTYHLPMSEWDKLNSHELDRAPEWDGHTSEDVIRLLGNL